jgi:hypothetical protein
MLIYSIMSVSELALPPAIEHPHEDIGKAFALIQGALVDASIVNGAAFGESFRQITDGFWMHSKPGEITDVHSPDPEDFTLTVSIKPLPEAQKPARRHWVHEVLTSAKQKVSPRVAANVGSIAAAAVVSGALMKQGLSHVVGSVVPQAAKALPVEQPNIAPTAHIDRYRPLRQAGLTVGYLATAAAVYRASADVGAEGGFRHILDGALLGLVGEFSVLAATVRISAWGAKFHRNAERRANKSYAPFIS